MVSAISREIRSALGRGNITPEAIQRAADVVAARGHSLDGLDTFTSVLLDAYEAGRMPAASRVAFRSVVARLHEQTYEAALAPSTVRLSPRQLRAAVDRTGRLIARNERAIAALEARLEETIGRIDQREKEAGTLVASKKKLLGEAETAKDRSQVATLVKSILGLAPGAKLAVAAALFPALSGLALAALLFGGYSAVKGLDEIEQLAMQIVDLERKIRAADEQLGQLRASRETFDENLGALRAALEALKVLEASYRSKDTTAPNSLLALAKQMRRNELVAYTLKQQIGVLSSMNDHADELDGQLAALVEALTVEVAEAEQASREAEADFLTTILGGVLGAAGITGTSATVIREAVLLVQVGPEVTVIDKMRRALENLGIDESKRETLCGDAAALVDGIDSLVRHRAHVLDPAFDEDLARMSEPQRFLVDVALSRLNTKIDPAKMIAMVREADVDDRTARKVAKMVRRGDTTALDLLG